MPFPMPPGQQHYDPPRLTSFKYTWMNRLSFGFAFTLVSAVILGGAHPADGSTASTAIWDLGVGISIVGLLRIMTIGITIRADSLVIRNVFRTHRIRFSEIASVEWVPRYSALQFHIRLTDGRAITPTATMITGPKDGGLDAAYAIQRRLAALRGGPAPRSPSEMMRLGQLPPPPAGSGRTPRAT